MMGDRSLAKLGVHSGCCYPHTLPSEEPRQAWNLRRLNSNLDSCQRVSFKVQWQGPASPLCQDLRQHYLLYMFLTQRWPAHILPCLLIAIQESAQPSYHADSNLITSNSKFQVLRGSYALEKAHWSYWDIIKDYKNITSFTMYQL